MLKTELERHELIIVDLMTLKYVTLSTLFKYFNNFKTLFRGKFLNLILKHENTCSITIGIISEILIRK